MNRYFNIILYIIGIAVFILLVLNFGLQNILINIGKTGWWIVPVLVAWGFVYLFNTYAWYLTLGAQKNEIRFSRLLRISLSGFALNYITPFLSLGGEPYRMYAVKQYVGLNRAVSSVTLYNMLHVLSHLILWLLTIPITIMIIPLNPGIKYLLIAVAIVLSVLIMLFFSPHKYGFFQLILILLKKIPFFNGLRSKLQRAENSVIEIDYQIKEFNQQRKTAFYLALLLEFSARIIASLEFFFIMKSVEMEISILQAVYINAATSFILNLFFFMPMELGVREAGLYLIFNTFSVTPGIGIYVALINRIRELFWILVGVILIKIKSYEKTKESEYLREKI